MWPEPDTGGIRHRPITVADLDAVMAVEVAAYPAPWSRGNFVDSLAAGYVAERRDAADGQLIGYWLAMPGVDELHLLNLTVAPHCQRQGHGRALLERVVACAAGRGDGSVLLEVRQSNLAAQALYRQRGFTQDGLRRAYYPDPRAGAREDALLMRLRLPRADAMRRPD